MQLSTDSRLPKPPEDIVMSGKTGRLTTTIDGGYLEFSQYGAFIRGRNWNRNNPTLRELKRNEMYMRRQGRKNR